MITSLNLYNYPTNTNLYRNFCGVKLDLNRNKNTKVSFRGNIGKSVESALTEVTDLASASTLAGTLMLTPVKLFVDYQPFINGTSSGFIKDLIYLPVIAAFSGLMCYVMTKLK